MTDWHNRDQQGLDDIRHALWVLQNQADEIVDAELAALTSPTARPSLGDKIITSPEAMRQLLNDLFPPEQEEP